MEKRFAVFISVLLSAIIIITSDIIVDYRYRNSFNEWIQYQVPQTAKAYNCLLYTSGLKCTPKLGLDT